VRRSTWALAWSPLERIVSVIGRSSGYGALAPETCRGASQLMFVVAAAGEGVDRLCSSAVRRSLRPGADRVDDRSSAAASRSHTVAALAVAEGAGLSGSPRMGDSSWRIGGSR
jgi:hypothetical protein